MPTKLRECQQTALVQTRGYPEMNSAVPTELGLAGLLAESVHQTWWGGCGERVTVIYCWWDTNYEDSI